jgi:hypothetical protein
MQKRISFMPNVHESRVQTGQYFPNPAEEYIPNRIPLVSLIAVQLCELTVLQQGDLYLS